MKKRNTHYEAVTIVRFAETTATPNTKIQVRSFPTDQILLEFFIPTTTADEYADRVQAVAARAKREGITWDHAYGRIQPVMEKQ